MLFNSSYIVNYKNKMCFKTKTKPKLKFYFTKMNMEL